VFCCVVPVSAWGLVEANPSPRSDASTLLLCVAAGTLSDIEVPFATLDVPVVLVDVEVPFVLLEVALEFADAGKFKTCPTCSSVGTTSGLASSSCRVVMPSAAAIALSVSPGTTV
jgi:hypothetical protein